MSGKFPDAPRAVRWLSPHVEEWVRDQIKAAGGDPADVPSTGFKFLTLASVREMTGLSVSSIYRLMDGGKFPRPIPVDMPGARERASVTVT